MDNPSFCALKSAFCSIKELPYCEGSIELGSLSSKVFYHRDGTDATVIDFLDANDEQLKALADACQPASFGINNQDVLDETYRKAGKMDNTKFSTQFNPRDLGILDHVVSNLIEDSTVEEVFAELYKLNVYGPGSFFKPHVDTPRSDDMIGSLVVVLPTTHEGGTLVFRHDQHEWKFDSATMLGSGSKVVYAAFLGDVEHEVLPVTAGYRVTLTYNLYSRERAAPTAAPLNMQAYRGISEMRNALSALLDDDSFLPRGGFLAWGLSHRYPVSEDTLPSAIKLRGVDLITYRLCNELGLNMSLKAIYRGYYNKSEFCLVNKFVDLESAGQIEESLVTHIAYYHGGRVCRALGHGHEDDEDDEYYDDDDDEYPSSKVVAFVKPLTHRNSIEATYVAYGNEASLGTAYGEVCLVAWVGSPDDRVE